MNTKYVVLEEKYASWIISQAKIQYKDLYKNGKQQDELNSYIENTYKMSSFSRSQNDFSIQTLMVFNNQNPIGSIEINTFPRLDIKLEQAKKPMYINKLFYSDIQAVEELFRKVENIALQKNHDFIYGEFLSERKDVIKIIQNRGYKIYHKNNTLTKTNLKLSTAIKSINKEND
ncbi:hypothetical protein JM658_02160 [Joostella atrarenae]|uniref:GNAT family N-acetyltransferase n=1 Tax=Joostella atrarenae TaxID=679257 RepID=A0ABS9IZK3_9FLAO|nr:hypothetical protein [Joostella atrarenae]MCF8713617.1 hypothetical protein [Joostella atrarenae]